jgi:hypothetical protein
MTSRSTSAPPIRTFIYGSCVSRDTFSFLDPSRYTLVNYVARQSLVSAFSTPGPPLVDPAKLNSAFQRRMLEQDAASALPNLLQDAAAETDILLWDIFDERLGYFPGQEAAASTNSVEIQRLAQQEASAAAPAVAFGTRRHFKRFAEALEQFAELLSSTGLLQRTLLIAPPWATCTDTGAVTPTSFGLDAHSANEKVQTYIDLIASTASIPVLRTDPAVTVASSSHRWGAAPFHYVDEVYTRLVDQIEATLGRLVHVPESEDLRLSYDGTNLRVSVRPQDNVRTAFRLYRGSKQIAAKPYGTDGRAVFEGVHGGDQYLVRAYLKSLGATEAKVVSSGRFSL